MCPNAYENPEIVDGDKSASLLGTVGRIFANRVMALLYWGLFMAIGACTMFAGLKLGHVVFGHHNGTVLPLEYILDISDDQSSQTRYVQVQIYETTGIGPDLDYMRQMVLCFAIVGTLFGITVNVLVAMKKRAFLALIMAYFVLPIPIMHNIQFEKQARERESKREAIKIGEEARDLMNQIEKRRSTR